MAKKKHVWSNPQQMIPNTKKQMLKLMQDPDKMKDLIRLTEAAEKTVAKMNDVYDDLSEWATFALMHMSENLIVSQRGFVDEFNELLLKYELKDTEIDDVEKDNEEDCT